ncbi:MAG: redoxin domain-containing protein [Phycisphaeraceae bacterium]|nr:MAG: redoxin domain-containing protein [Phycisphaeraceae bacterium]
MRTPLLLLAALMVNPAVAGDDFRHLGEGSRLASLAELETKPFAPDLLGKIDGWTDEPITPERLKDRVLVLLAWDNDEARSVRLLPKFARYAREAGDDVLILALHADQGWDGARERVDSGRIRCPVAHDAGGEVFKALDVDEDPNIYLVDRAANIRVADIDPRDLDKAIAQLKRETPDEARADLPSRIEHLAEVRRLTPPATAGGDRGGPSKPGGAKDADIRVPAEAYARAPWPARNTGQLYATDLQGQRLPVPLGNEEWLTPKPEAPLEQHVLVLDFWATWCGPCRRASPMLDAIQKKHKGEVLVLAISGQAHGSQYPEDPATIRAFMQQHPVSYSYLSDMKQTLYNRFDIKGIPHTVVVSTDGVIRWQGIPLVPGFEEAVEQVIAADPLLAARRAAADGG